ncbi:hypothetical protein [Kocuria palustris]|uniref:hypothetical protein n=1 Tax=Kocuria palustris TaxID=71999 RepID=UPI0012E852ED
MSNRSGWASSSWSWAISTCCSGPAIISGIDLGSEVTVGQEKARMMIEMTTAEISAVRRTLGHGVTGLALSWPWTSRLGLDMGRPLDRALAP